MLIGMRNAMMVGGGGEPQFIGTRFYITVGAEHMTMGFNVEPGSWSQNGVTIDWGDGTLDVVTVGRYCSHEYAVAGSYVVSVSDDVGGFVLWESTSSPFQHVCTRFICNSAHRINIGDNACRLSIVEYVELPEDYYLGSVGNATFWNAQQLKTIISHNPTPPTLNSNCWQSNKALQGIYVPASAVEDYKAAAVWALKASYIQPLESLPTA